jgi:hypothetical protein
MINLSTWTGLISVGNNSPNNNCKTGSIPIDLMIKATTNIVSGIQENISRYGKSGCKPRRYKLGASVK